MKKKYAVTLTGTGSFSSPPSVFIEYSSVKLTSTDGSKSWKNAAFETDADGVLNIELKCEAMSGTTWKFSVKDLELSKNVYEAEGETGERLGSRGGRRIPNFSERIAVYDYDAQRLLV